LLGFFVLSVALQGELVEVDWLLAGLAAAGSALKDGVQGERCLG
jgi:hypothetical protein